VKIQVDDLLKKRVESGEAEVTQPRLKRGEQHPGQSHHRARLSKVTQVWQGKKAVAVIAR
jgi:hypothetical protein